MEISPNYALAYCNRGYALIELKQLHQALDDLNKAIELDPKIARAYYGRGKGHFEKK